MRMETGIPPIEETSFEDISLTQEKEPLDWEKVETIIDGYQAQKTHLISILLEIQSEFNYLPKQALSQVAKRLDISVGEVYSIATFYKAFSLKPRGKHIITVCLGTACHVRGGNFV